MEFLIKVKKKYVTHIKKKSEIRRERDLLAEKNATLKDTWIWRAPYANFLLLFFSVFFLNLFIYILSNMYELKK